MSQAKIAAIFLTGVAVGGAGTYWAVTSHTKQKYERLLEEEVGQVKDHYRIIHKKDSYASPDDLLAERKEKEAALEEYKMNVSAYEIETERKVTGPATNHSELESRSVFDYSQLGKTEDKTVVDQSSAYAVTYEEFDGENEEYTKTTLTYFKGDDTVADEVDDIIQDVEATLGSEGLTSFGKLDPDNPDVAYIRNDRLRTDYEVILEERSFREVVVGE